MWNTTRREKKGGGEGEKRKDQELRTVHTFPLLPAATYSSQASVYTARSWTYQEERKNRMNAQSVNPVSVRRNSPAGLVLANGSPTGSAATTGRTESQKILALRLGCTHTTQCLLLDNPRT